MDVRELMVGMTVSIKHSGLTKGKITALGSGHGARHNIEILSGNDTGKTYPFTSRAVLGGWTKEMEDHLQPIEARRIQQQKDELRKEIELEQARVHAEEIAELAAGFGDEHTHIKANRVYSRTKRGLQWAIEIDAYTLNVIIGHAMDHIRSFYQDEPDARPE